MCSALAAIGRLAVALLLPAVEACLASALASSCVTKNQVETVGTPGVPPCSRGRSGWNPWSAASLARPIRPEPVERCLACEADSVGTTGSRLASPFASCGAIKCDADTVGTPGAPPCLPGQNLALHAAFQVVRNELPPARQAMAFPRMEGVQRIKGIRDLLSALVRQAEAWRTR